ncbi:MAG: MaoC/PaaZ C-terminal domain-containing protein [Polaromonas sp.]|uniref:3-hydroxyacyl-ACP dehydratase FabZ family protein n=1 Tax=Polaromonas sp. TaxID=1869339 RepID=UPI00273732F4|nr:MaoC/PaaZ C-terminal domain-containing protein [Polaromonas sp.]MDP2818295.1 MaoC/PaaZ C-terminal domain-containing protein [Polaromonas sp.]
MQGETSLSFAAGHPAFAGHFPGRPIVPGVLLLDAAIHAVLQARQGADSGSATCQVSSAKFLSPVSPDESLTLSWRDTGKGQVRFDIAGSGRQVATGVLGFGPP